MIIKYKLKKRTISKLRIVFKQGYVHEMWVYNLKIDKEGQYTWSHCDAGNRIIDLQPEEISTIFVVKQKNTFYWSKKRPPRKKKPQPNVVLNMFKPKKVTPMSMRTGVERKKLYDKATVQDDVQLLFTKGLDDSKFGY